ncbi:MAG: NAD-dependent deacylase [Chitinophagia bacterium]|nr:NAD-dependent deacylase [Chitinophagia bacterium]
MAKKNMVVLTGAGISAESGLKTFRDHNGLWENYRIEDVATATALRKNPALVLAFYNMRRLEMLKAVPNAAHYGLVELEQWFNVIIITQNVDDLHERSGSTHILHLHGELTKMRSVKTYAVTFPYTQNIELGQRAPDGGQLRPHIVLFEEPVPNIEIAAQYAAMADLFVVIGTSLAVYPAAGLIDLVPHHVPKFIIDKDIPPVNHLNELTAIPLPATQGIPVLINHPIVKEMGM